MIFVSSSLLTLVALVQNIFYVYTPPEINHVFVQLGSETASTNGTWVPLLFKRLRNMPLFFIPLPDNNTDYLHFKLKVHYLNGTTSDSSEWTTITSTKLMNEFQTNETTSEKLAVNGMSGIIPFKKSDAIRSKQEVLTLVALVNNIFYVSTPPGISRLFVQLDSETVSIKETWTPLLFKRFKTMPLYFIPISRTPIDYVHFRLMVSFIDGTPSKSTSWTTITSTETWNTFQTNETTEKLKANGYWNITLINKSGVVQKKQSDSTNLNAIPTNETTRKLPNSSIGGNEKTNVAKDNQSIIDHTKLISNRTPHGNIVKAVHLAANGNGNKNSYLITILFFLSHLPVYLIN